MFLFHECSTAILQNSPSLNNLQIRPYKYNSKYETLKEARITDMKIWHTPSSAIRFIKRREHQNKVGI